MLLTSHSKKTLCVLPSESRLSYRIAYRNGEFDFGGNESRTVSTGANDLSDLVVPTVLVKPGESARFRVTLESESKPKGTAGDLTLEFQCRPFYKGDAYRGVPLYRHPMHIALPVVVAEHERTKEWTIRAVKAQSSPRTSKESTQNPDPDDRDRRTQRIASGVASLLAKEHLSRRPLDDEISRRCLKTFLDRLDPWKLYFTKADVDGFMRQQNDLDEQLRQGDARFAFAAFKTLVERIKGQADLLDEILANKQNFSLDEQKVVEPYSTHYTRDESHCREKWRQRIKYDLFLLNAVGIEPSKAVKRLAARYRRIAGQILRTDDEELLEMYLTSLAAAYDPHSAYLSDKTLSWFRISHVVPVGISAQLADESGYVIVRRIIPGGADQNGQLAVGAKILGVGQGADGEIEDVVGMKFMEVVALTHGNRDTVVRLEVVAAGGQGKTLTITRSRIESKHQQVTGKIHQTGQKSDGQPCKIGVIDVPAFYLDMAGARRKEADFRCASRDVRKILEDFGKKGVDAVVLDVRHSVDGGLTEPIKIVGLFIDQGPVAQVKSADGKVKSYGDEDPGTAWDGPLVVLTGRSSYLYSEILAGAIQDYRRGLIVGDGPTCGRGTVGSLIDLGCCLSPDRGPRLGAGALKITSIQLYRPSGDSTQYRGVLPDVILPSAAAVFTAREADLDYAMPFDRVKPTKFERLDQVNDEVRQSLKESLARRRGEATYLQEVLAIAADYARIE